MLAAAREAGVEALVEVHDRAELDRALALGATIVGINNRDLRTFTIDRELAIRLRALVPPDRVVVAESGIRDAADVERLRAAGVDAMLVGETLMRAPDPGSGARGAAGLPWPDARPFLIKICGVTTRRGCGHGGVGRRGRDRRQLLAGLEALRRRRGGGAPRARGHSAGVLRVGVFVNAAPVEVERARAELGLDRVQLHGDETPAAFGAIPREALIRAVRVRDEVVVRRRRRLARRALPLRRVRRGLRRRWRGRALAADRAPSGASVPARGRPDAGERRRGDRARAAGWRRRRQRRRERRRA